jgi:replication-associated recombination protein RarA
LTGLDEHPDFIHVAPDPKTIRLQAVQQAIGRSQTSPLWSPAIVVWIDQVTAMTPEAENSLLKSLEEPHQALQYILTTDRADRVLPTVRSRCQVLFLNRMAAETEPFEMEQLSDRSRDLASVLISAGESVRAAFMREPNPRLFALFQILFDVHQRLEHNSNQELARERVRIAWEETFFGHKI